MTQSGQRADALLGLRAILPQAPSPAVTVSIGASWAMEMTLSRKWTKRRTRGCKLHLTKTKARFGRVRQTRADLERQLIACKREIANVRERLIEATKQQTAASEMLRVISDSPLQSVLDAVAEHAARLCDSNNAEIYRLENNLLRLVASYGEIPVHIQAREGFPVNRGRVMGRAICDRRSVHVHDLAAEDSEYPSGSSDAKRQGHRTTLGTPLLRERTPIGVILFRRWEVRPFSDNQIALLESFAGQAAIAIENVRLFEAEKQRTLALAQANRDLAEREAKIRRLVESNVIGIFIWDFDGRVLEANDEFLRMVNYDREDLVSGRIRWTDLTPPDWRERDNAKIEQQKISGRLEPFEKEYTRKDGRRVPVLIGVATFEEGGNEGVAFVLDLTERKRDEQALVRSEAYLAETQKLTHTGSWAWDPRNQKVLYCSKEMFRIHGLDPQEHSPSRKNFRQRIHPDDRNSVDERFTRLVNEKVGSFDEYRVVLPDGTVRHVDSSAHPFLDGNGELIEFIGTATDVTERKRAEEALRESEYKLRQIIETVPGLLWSLDPDGKLTDVNQRFLDYSGMRFEDFKHGGWEALMHPDDYAEIARTFYHAIQTGTSYQDVMRLRRADGEFRWYHVRSDPLRDRQGRIIQWYGLSVDIDEAKKAEDRLRRSESHLAEAQLELAHANRVATMGQLTASITHEVNQPITAAVTYALAARRYLSAEPPNFREVDDALSLIVKEGNRAGEVVDRIRALIKKAPARKDAVEINDAILEVIALTHTEAAKNNVSVRTQLAEDLPYVHGDRVQLQQVLLNLFINAIEAMRDVGEEKRELLISTGNEPDGVLVEVRDTGPGLSPESLSRLFEPFYTTKPEGMGMGLSICRSIIEAHGGRLWAIPCEPHGALFQVTIPLTAAIRD
jgi:PAS domain S-box-containing protein